MIEIITKQIKLFLRKLTRKNKEINISKVSHQVKLSHLTYLSEQKISNIENCIREISRKRIPGMFTEFGVALGGSAIIIAKLMPKERVLHGYDVFEMIPSPSDSDDEKSQSRYEVIKSGKSEGINGDIYYGYIQNLYEKVIENFKKFGLEVDNKKHIFLHKGLFEKTIAFTQKDKIAFAHIDCDWYEPVQFCLNKLYPLISKGGYIILDDYHDYGGCKKAVDEFIETNNDFKIIKNDSNLVLKRQ